MSNCMFEATLQRIEIECNCVPRYFSELVPEIEICNGPGASCMKKLLNLMGDYRTVFDNGTEKVCLANCIDQQYDVRVTSASYANKLAFLQSPEFCLVYEKLLKSCQTEKRFTLEESYSDICSLLASSHANSHANNHGDWHKNSSCIKVLCNWYITSQEDAVESFHDRRRTLHNNG